VQYLFPDAPQLAPMTAARSGTSLNPASEPIEPLPRVPLLDLIEPDAARAAERINTAWQKGIIGIVETGRLLIAQRWHDPIAASPPFLYAWR
jgi:hypothetical protein